MNRPALPAILLPWFLLASCATSTERQLQRVAKDWSLLVRASQVVPVYPLTEDLQPGDVFLVETPVERQQEQYRTDGFLPLEQHLARLHPQGYGEFYGRSFAERFAEGLPRSQQRPPAGRAWQSAPRSGFPAYSFSVRQGAGLDLALPVQGVPIGLALLGARAAEGSVSLQDTRTLGVDTLSLYRQVLDWAAENRDLLVEYGASPPRNYLRVVRRIHLVGKVGIELRAAEQFGGGLDAGAAAPVPPLQPGLPPSERAEAGAGYAAVLDHLNQALADSLAALAGSGPGGSLRVTAAGARTVALAETFEPPLVFGYLGFDVAILDGGVLGPPVPTRAVLDPSRWQDLSAGARRAFEFGQRAVTRQVYTALRALAADDPAAAARVAELDALASLVPEAETVYRSLPGGVLVEESWSPASELPPFLRFRAWRGRLRLSVQVLERLLAGDSLRLQGREAPVTPDSPEWQRLQGAKASLEALLDDPGIRSRLRAASAAAWSTFYRATEGFSR